MEMQEKRTDKEVIPAGIFYYNIGDPVVEAEAGEIPTKEEAEEQMLKALRMNGLVNSKLEVIRHLDHSIKEESDVIPVVLKNGLVQEGRSSVANAERFELLRQFAREKLKTMGQEILEGKDEARPVKQGMRTACDYCPYHPVCGFDLKTDGFSYRVFPKTTPEEVWKEMEKNCGNLDEREKIADSDEKLYENRKTQDNEGEEKKGENA